MIQSSGTILKEADEKNGAENGKSFYIFAIVS
jgi:hypothetical protein